jgi:hypothetical protein
LDGRSLDSQQTIWVEGMQIVAWLVQVLPTLPPLPDPALPPSGLARMRRRGPSEHPAGQAQALVEPSPPATLSVLAGGAENGAIGSLVTA